MERPRFLIDKRLALTSAILAAGGAAFACSGETQDPRVEPTFGPTPIVRNLEPTASPYLEPAPTIPAIVDNDPTGVDVDNVKVLKIGDKVPNFQVFDITQNSKNLISFEDFRGKPLLILFAYSTYGRNFSTIETLKRQYAQQGLEYMAVFSDEEFARESESYGFNAVLFDREISSGLYEMFDVRGPKLAIIDRSGTLVDVRESWEDYSAVDLIVERIVRGQSVLSESSVQKPQIDSDERFPIDAGELSKIPWVKRNDELSDLHITFSSTGNGPLNIAGMPAADLQWLDYQVTQAEAIVATSSGEELYQAFQLLSTAGEKVAQYYCRQPETWTDMAVRLVSWLTYWKYVELYEAGKVEADRWPQYAQKFIPPCDYVPFFPPDDPD